MMEMPARLGSGYGQKVSFFGNHIIYMYPHDGEQFDASKLFIAPVELQFPCIVKFLNFRLNLFHIAVTWFKFSYT